MNPLNQYICNITRRHFFQQGSHVLGGAALDSLMGRDGISLGSQLAAAEPQHSVSHHSVAHHSVAHHSVAHHPGAQQMYFPPKAKNVIYFHMVGGPPQMDLYDDKPAMNEYTTTKTCPNRFARGSGSPQ